MDRATLINETLEKLFGPVIVTRDHVRSVLEAFAAALLEPQLNGLPPTETRATLEQALANAHGDKSVAAKRLGLTRRTLYRRLERYGLGERIVRRPEGKGTW